MTRTMEGDKQDNVKVTPMKRAVVDMASLFDEHIFIDSRRN